MEKFLLVGMLTNITAIMERKDETIMYFCYQYYTTKISLYKNYTKIYMTLR